MSRLGEMMRGLPRPTLPRRRKIRCSFCDRRVDEVQKLIAGPEGVGICGECVGFCNEIIEEETMSKEAANTSGEVVEGSLHPPLPGEKHRCSFCNKSQDDVSKLLSGPESIHICNECVELCNEIIEEDAKWEDQNV